MPKILAILFILLKVVVLTPVARRSVEFDGKVFFDQRQEGEWNVRADLRNFVILIIPTRSSSSSSSSSSTPSPSSSGTTLLDLLSKTIPHGRLFRKDPPRHQPHHTDNVSEETAHFIESKTAPYHVDISKSKANLAKLHPGDIVIANSPSLALVKETAKPLVRQVRETKAFVFTLPYPDDRTISEKKEKKDIYKKKGIGLKLLGAEFEQCGPGLSRDSYGICRLIKY